LTHFPPLGYPVYHSYTQRSTKANTHITLPWGHCKGAPDFVLRRLHAIIAGQGGMTISRDKAEKPKLNRQSTWIWHRVVLQEHIASIHRVSPE